MTDQVAAVATSVAGGSANRWSRLLLFPLLAATLVLCPLSWKWRDTLKVRRVFIEGSQIISARQLSLLANVPVQSSLHGTDLYAVRKRVLSQPFVNTAVIYPQFPDILRIRVTER